jgi:hypothetical protein
MTVMIDPGNAVVIQLAERLRTVSERVKQLRLAQSRPAETGTTMVIIASLIFRRPKRRYRVFPHLSLSALHWVCVPSVSLRCSQLSTHNRFHPNPLFSGRKRGRLKPPLESMKAFEAVSVSHNVFGAFALRFWTLLPLYLAILFVLYDCPTLLVAFA